MLKIKITLGTKIWLTIICLMILAAVAAPLLTSADPSAVNLAKVLNSPSSTLIMGTDNMGRDVFSRLLYGGRVTMLVALAATVISTVLGILYGGVSGYIGGRTDDIMMRLLEALIAIPSLIIILCLQAFLHGGLIVIIVIIGLTSWMQVARIVRAGFVETKSKNFVKCAVMLGTPARRIFIRHLLRNSLSGILVITIYNCASAVFTEVTLSFLGLGIPPEMASWGNMLTNAQNYMLVGAWWIALYPGLMIVLLILAVNFLGERAKRYYGFKGEIYDGIH